MGVRPTRVGLRCRWRKRPRAPTAVAITGGSDPLRVDPTGDSVAAPGPRPGLPEWRGRCAVNTESTKLVGPKAPNWGGPRLSMTNPADSPNSGYSLSSRRPLKREESLCSLLNSHPADRRNVGFSLSSRQSRKRPLTDRDGITLRKEVRDLDHRNIDENRPISWNGAINRYRHYIRDKREVETVFQNCETGEIATGSTPHRFDPDYSAKLYAKLKDLERGVQSRFGKRLHTGILTLTASSTPNGDPLPGVDHLDELLSSWSSVSRTLRRVLDGRRSARLAILEPHPSDGPNNGYLHIHIAVFVDGKIKPETFQPVIDAHLRNCDPATVVAHTTDDIQIRHAGADRQPGYLHSLAEGIEYDSDQLGEIAIYLSEYLGTYGDDDPLEAPEHVQAANALLWATNRQRWRPCSTAQSLMAYSGPDTATDWEVVGIETNGERITIDNTGGGVDTFVTGSPNPPDPPPTDH